MDYDSDDFEMFDPAEEESKPFRISADDDRDDWRDNADLDGYGDYD